MSTSHNLAVIWDMDGVIVDTAVHHHDAWVEAFAKRDVAFSKEDFAATFGTRNDDVIRRVLGRKTPAGLIQEISEEKEADYRRRAADKLTALPGVVALLEDLAVAGFKQAIGTSAPPANVRQIMQTLGLEEYFDCVVTEKDVSEGKPSPQSFLLAARTLDVPAANCVVIEDAVAGVSAARRAGMRCVAVTNSHSRYNLGRADLVVDSLEDVSAEKLCRLLGITDEPTGAD
jgi:beta-phosphoglucomutase family hydrolase